MGGRNPVLPQALRRQRGSSLLEVVAALGLLAATAVAMMTVLTTHAMSTRSADANDQAINLVRTQLEDIKNATYNTANCYPVTATAPSGYSVTVTVVLEQTNLQRVTVAASRAGTPYFTIEIYKANLTGTTVNQPC